MAEFVDDLPSHPLINKVDLGAGSFLIWLKKSELPFEPTILC